MKPCSRPQIEFRNGVFAASTLSVIFAETVFSLTRDFSAVFFAISNARFRRPSLRSAFLRLSLPQLYRCFLTAVFLTAGLARFLQPFSYRSFLQPLLPPFSRRFFSQPFLPKSLRLSFCNRFFRGFRNGFFCSRFFGRFFGSGLCRFFRRAAAVLALAVFSVVFVLAISLSFAETIPHPQQY